MQSIAFEPNSTQSYVFVADSRLVRLEHETNQWFYYLKDHLGSSDFIMSSSGLPVEQMLYHAYGSEEQPQAISTQWKDHVAENQDALPKEKTHHRFTGKYLDDETGLYDFGARFYDPTLGRFISPDDTYLNTPSNCLTTVRECNLYIYSLNNPLKFVDDDGNSIWSKLAKVAVKVYKGGSAADAFADNVKDAMTLMDSNASVGDRLWAAASLASELLPVSVSDVKDVKRIVEKTPIGKPNEKVYSNAKDRIIKSKPSGKCCFVAGTQVLTESGYKNIEDIQLGEKLWAKNTDTGEQDWKPVTWIFVEPDREIYEIQLVGVDQFKQKIEATDDHPFYVIGKGWKTTIELAVGDQIETDGFMPMTVEAVIDQQRVDLTYNFTVADFHTYYVTERNVLVHNCETCNGGSCGTSNNVTSRIKESPKLVKEAEVTGKSHQEGIDKLTAQLQQGNLNPGIGTKPIGKGLSEARGRDGSRVYFKTTNDGVEVLGKSNKSNQQKVIKEVLQTFGNE